MTNRTAPESGADRLHVLELQPSDKQIAEGYAARMRKALGEVCAIENEAAVEGFAFNYSVGFNSFGRKAVQMLTVLKAMTSYFQWIAGIAIVALGRVGLWSPRCL